MWPAPAGVPPTQACPRAAPRPPCRRATPDSAPNTSLTGQERGRRVSGRAGEGPCPRCGSRPGGSAPPPPTAAGARPSGTRASETRAGAPSPDVGHRSRWGAGGDRALREARGRSPARTEPAWQTAVTARRPAHGVRGHGRPDKGPTTPPRAQPCHAAPSTPERCTPAVRVPPEATPTGSAGDRTPSSRLPLCSPTVGMRQA